MRMFRKGLLAASLALVPMAALAGGIPLVPSNSQFNEPSQIIATLNAIINQLNGNAAGNGGYAVQPGTGPSLGSFCTASGATPQTCNGSRGQVTFTGVTAAANANATAQVVNDNLVTAQSSCNVTLQVAGAANSGPVVSSVVPGAGTLTITLTNATATSTGSFSPSFSFNCVN